MTLPAPGEAPRRAGEGAARIPSIAADETAPGSAARCGRCADPAAAPVALPRFAA
jgi:hypothetical protein